MAINKLSPVPLNERWAWSGSDAGLRVRANQMLIEAGICPPRNGYDMLRAILGVDNIYFIDDQCREALRKLAGPHGLVLAKMIMAQRGLSDGF